MKQYIKIISNIFTSTYITLIPLISFAQITNPLASSSSIPQFIDLILGYVIRIGGVIAIFAFIYAGFKFVQARGNEKELGEAKNIFFNTVIGVAVLLGAKIISSIIVGTINTLR